MRHISMEHTIKGHRLEFGLKHLAYTEKLESVYGSAEIDDSRHGLDVDGMEEKDDEVSTTGNDAYNGGLYESEDDRPAIELEGPALHESELDRRPPW